MPLEKKLNKFLPIFEEKISTIRLEGRNS